MQQHLGSLDGVDGARFRWFVFALLAAAGLASFMAPAAGQQQGPRVLVTRIDASITPVVADQLKDGVERAATGGYDAYVVELDTPGGLDTSMREIVQHFLDSDVPVIVYVSPRGARAASAGAIITFAANVAAMAPGTAIGAATPVGGGSGEDLDRKIVNDAAAFAESIAQERGRDVEFVVETVREGRSASAREALDLGAVDLVADSLRDLLRDVDGTEVVVGSGDQVTLRTAGADVDRYDMGLFRRILQFLADPNIAFLLLSLGTLGLIYELGTPGVGVAGVTGALLIVLALFALSLLPVNVVGLLLLALAAALFVAEVVAPGFAGFAAGGAVVLVLSGVFLFDDASGVSVSLGLLLPIAVVVGVAVVIAGRLAVRSRRALPTTGLAQFTGAEVTVARSSGETGQAFVEGAWWTVRSPGADLHDGERVRVVGAEGLTLVVQPAEPVEQGRQPNGETQ